MANTNNIYDDNYRMNFLKKADLMAINDYLKNMEKLSAKKGGQFLEMYNRDLDFLMTLGDSSQNGGGDIPFMFAGQNSVTMTEGPADTEAFVSKLNSITKRVIGEGNISSNSADLMAIRDSLINESMGVGGGDQWIKAIRKFIDILMTNGRVVDDADIPYFLEIPKLIVGNKMFVKEAFEYLNKVLKNKSNVSNDFIRKYLDLQKNKDKIVKEELLQKAFDQYGCGRTFLNKFIAKIMIATKKYTN